MKLATACESFVATCFDSGNFEGSLEAYIERFNASARECDVVAEHSGGTMWKDQNVT